MDYNRSLNELVKEFHQKLNISNPDSPQVINDERVRLRLNLIAEKFFRLLESSLGQKLDFLKESTFEAIRECHININIKKLADCMTNLDYVTEGMRLELGIDGEQILNEVHEANMGSISKMNPK